MKTLCRHDAHALCLVLMLSGHSARAQVAPVLKGAKDKRTEGVFYRPDANRQYVMMFDPSQEAKFSSQLDERADYFYEVVTTPKGMVIADRSSHMDLTKNADGSVDIYMGPKAPKGF
jgi:hypothetical protein